MSMGNFQGGSNRGGGYRGGGGGNSNFQKKSWGDDRGGDRNTPLFKAVCNECGKSCEVPFRPSGEKPVYCSACFSVKRGEGVQRSPSGYGDRSPRREYGERSEARSEYRKEGDDEGTKKLLGDIGNKLDRILNAIERLTDIQREVLGAEGAPLVSPKVVAKKSSVKEVSEKVKTSKKKKL